MWWVVGIVSLLSLVEGGIGTKRCDVIQPFRVSPDNAKYLLGGVFALHGQDCTAIKPDAVQELMAVQWALSHWNLNPANRENKIALYAGNSCSQPNESLSQVIGYLSEAGKFSKVECQKNLTSEALGLLLPTDGASAKELSTQLDAFDLVTISYTTGSSEGYPRAISVAPRLSDYVNVAQRLLTKLQSNYLAILTNPNYADIIQKLSSEFDENIVISDMLQTNQDNIQDQLKNLKSNIILCFGTKLDIYDLLQTKNIGTLGKLVIFIPLEGEVLGDEEMSWLAPEITNSTIIILQQHTSDLPTFRQYFLDILNSNYNAYPLLASYMSFIYNCSTTKTEGTIHCADLSVGDLNKKFRQSPNIESVVLATYAMAAYSRMRKAGKTACDKGVISCNEGDFAQLLNYKFTEFDPSEFQDLKVEFDKSKRMVGAIIEGLQIATNPSLGNRVIKVLEAPSGRLNDFVMESASISWPNNQPITSTCPKFNPKCRKCQSYTSSDKLLLHRPGDLYVIGLFNWHNKARDQGPVGCGSVKSPRDILGPASFIYALETVKQRYVGLNLLPNVEIGSILVDSCDSVFSIFQPISEQQSKCSLVYSKRIGQNVTVAPEAIAGYLAGGPSGDFSTIKDLFSTDGIPLPLGAATSEKLPPLYHVFSSMPLYDWLAKSLVDLLTRFQWNYVSVLLSEEDLDSLNAFAAFRVALERSDICIADVTRLSGSKGVKPDASKPIAASAVLAFATAADMNDFVRTAVPKFNPSQAYTFILVGDSHNWDSVRLSRPNEEWKKGMWGSVSIQPRLPMIAEGIEAFIETLTPSRFPEPWFLEFWEDYFECSLSNGPKKYAYLCEGTEVFPTDLVGRLTKQSYLASALELLIFSLDGIYKKFCPKLQGLCEDFYNKFSDELKVMLKDVPKQGNFILYNYRKMDNEFAYMEIGNWSETSRLQVGDVPVHYVEGVEVSGTMESTCEPPLCRCNLDEEFFTKPIDIQADYVQKTEVSGRDLNMDVSGSQKSWNQRTWAYIFLIITGILLLCAISVLGLILAKLCSRVIKGNQSLGICLLCGVILLYVTAFFFIFDPSVALCRLRYMFHSFSYVICYGVMIAKATQLRNSETLGVNGFISYWNYWLLLLFIVCVQIALNLQWTMFRFPVVMAAVRADTNTVVLQCVWRADEFLLGQIYVVVLLLLALFIAIASRNVKRNYKEARWLMYTTGISIPVWIAWMVAYANLPTHFRDTVIVMELLVCATIILCFMFGPKLYILLSYEPVLVECPTQYPVPPGAIGGRGFEKVPSDEDSSSNSGGSVVAPSTKSSVVAESLTSKNGSTIYAAVVRKKSRCRKMKIDELSRSDLASHLPPPFTLSPVYRTNPIFQHGHPRN